MAHTIMSTTSTPSVVPGARRIPLWLKLAYTAFMAVLVPVYLRNYGPTNFLYFCDVALIITLIGIWLESPLLVSICAIGIVASQTLWVIDFLSNLIGHPLTGLTDYMFMADHSLLLRGLSLFHGWLPFLLVYLVWRLGYDGRALPIWTLVAWALVLISFFFHAAAAARSGPNPGEHRLRVGLQRHRGAALDAAGHLGGRIDDPVAGLALLPKPVRAW
jgi:hypothetical protein